MPQTDEELARKVAAMYGGTWASPQTREVETREPEVINDTPLREEDRYVVYIPTLPPPLSITDMSARPSHLDGTIVPFTRRKWATRLWVSEREEYDAEANVLTLYGHYRVHVFTVWVKDSGEGDE